MSEENKRGRGAPPGRRPIAFICLALINNKIKDETILVKDQAPDTDAGEFPESIAVAEFVKLHNVKPDKVIGPMRPIGGKESSSSASVKKKLNIRRDDMNVTLTETYKKAVLGEWEGLATEIKDNLDEMFFVFTNPNDSNKTVKKLPAPGVVKVSDLEFKTQ
jgi:hypothetical protein